MHVKNAINISKTTLKRETLNKIIWDNIILQIKIHFLYTHVHKFYMKKVNSNEKADPG